MAHFYARGNPAVRDFGFGFQKRSNSDFPQVTFLPIVPFI